MLSVVDYVIIVVYFLCILGIGAFTGKGQKSIRDYFLGSRNMPWYAAMFSGIATVVSAISYIGAPAVAFSEDFRYHQVRLGFPIALLALCLVFLPTFYKTNQASIYQYLGSRFDAKTQVFTSVLFVFLKLAYLGLAIYVPALVIEKMFDIPLYQTALFVGLFTVFYTVAGGIKAVIWTDTIQLFILTFGLVAVFAVAVDGVDGGLAQVIEVGRMEDKFRFIDFSFDLTEKYTFWGGVFGGAVLLVIQFGSDQAEVQRFLTTKSLRHSVASMIGTLFFTTLYGVFVFFVGTTLYSFYGQFPEKGAMLVEANEIFPKFIVEELPTGLKGLISAGVLSAGMSTVSSVLNSLTTVCVTDLYRRVCTETPSLNAVRGATFVIGIIGIALAMFMGSLGNVLEISVALGSFFGGPLVGVFLVGILNKRIQGDAAFCSLLLGFAFSIWLGFFTEVSFMWYGIFSAGVTGLSSLAIHAVGSRITRSE